MAKTDSKPKDKTAESPQQAPPTQLPATQKLRLPYPTSLKEWAGYDQRDWQVLTEVIFPLATTVGAILLAVEYCRSRKLDIMKKVVHIVPMRRKIPGSDKYEMVDTIWPGIAEVRITATRTGVYAGKDAAVFGPTLTEEFRHVDDRTGDVKKAETVHFPEWCQVTVYKMVQGHRCAFVGPKVYWKEAYASESFYSEIPNEMWKSRQSGQLEKCTEAASLRAAFPEELGGEYTSDEMAGKLIDTNQVSPGHYQTQDGKDVLVPPRPQQSTFQQPKKPEPKKIPAKDPVGDGRPEPTPLGEAVQAKAAEPQPEPEPAPEPVPETVVEDDSENADQVVEEIHEAEPAPTEAYMAASNLLDQLEETIPGCKDLDAFKKEGRMNIDKEPGLTDDERDMLRGRFTTMVLVEQKRRANKDKR
jgi:phage recombination protein Bet